MDRFRKVEKPRPESVAINDNEIRITSQGLIRNYVNYATGILQERSLRVIVLKAMGPTISKAVAATEIIKKMVDGMAIGAEVGGHVEVGIFMDMEVAQLVAEGTVAAAEVMVMHEDDGSPRL